MMYYPEMGEVAAPRIFKTHRCYRDEYYVEWLLADNDQAMDTLKKLRIKAKFLSFRPFNIDPLTRSGKWSCLVTGLSHDKLFSADLCAHEQLLD